MKTPQRGFIALISAVIISTLLLTLAVAIGSNTFFARFDALNHEYKRLSLGFAESCVTTALGNIGANYDYSASNALVSLGSLYGKTAECTISQVTAGSEVNGKKTFTIVAKANFNNAFSTINTQAVAQNPALAPVTPPPTCALNPTGVSAPGGTNVPFAWSTAGSGIDSLSMDHGVGGLSPFASGNGNLTAPISPGTYTYTVTVHNGGGTDTCNLILTVTTPPQAPSCADTVMVLDRSYSMFGYPSYPSGYSQWVPDEKTAAKSLVDLYSGVASSPKVGFGRIADLVTGHSADIVTHLTSNYAGIKNNIDNGLPQNPIGYTNLGEAIKVGAGELTTNGTKPKRVLIFISDGEPNEPTSTVGSTGTSSPSANLQNGTGDLWTNPAGAYADAGTDASDNGGHRERLYNFNFPSIPAGSTITGIVAGADAWSTSAAAAASTTLAASGVGAYDQWSANTGTRVSATQTNDGDTSYIGTAASVETFSFTGAGIPAGSVINSVTLTAVARGTASGASMQLVAENGGAPNAGSANALTTSYATYTRAMNTNPLTGAAWTLAEVNGWTTRFGVSAPSSAASVRVTQLSLTVNYTPEIPGTTGLKAPAATHAPSNWDTNAVGNVQTSNNVYISDGGDGDQQGYSGFGFAVPANATITGIDVSAEAKSSDSSGCQLAAAISQNGTNFNTPNGADTTALTSTDATLSFGGASDTWGRTWTPAEVNSANFTVRVQGVDPGFSCSGGSVTSIDQLRVNITYTVPGSSTNASVSATGVGGYDQWSTNTTDVASVSGNDGDTSFIHNATSVETFAVPNAGLPTGSTVNAVTIIAVARGTGSGASMQLVAENGGAPNAGSANALTTSYATYTRAMNTNPLTGAAWTLAEVNGWTTRFGVQTANGSATPRVTQFLVKIDYTAPATSSGCQLGVDLSWDGGNTWSSEKTATLIGTETTFTLGSASDDWSTTHAWGVNDFTNGNFRARVRDIDPGTSCADAATTHLDWLRLNVLYSHPVDASQYALDAAGAAKGSGVSIFSIHFGDAAGQPFMQQLASLSTIASSPIVTATRSGTIVTVTTSVPHHLTTNERVQISGTSSGTLNNTFTVTGAPTSNSFTFTTSSSGTINATGGSVLPTNLFLSPSSSAMSGIFQSIGYQICPAAAPACSNGQDDGDGDNLADELDPGCHTDGNASNPASYDPNDTDEWDPLPTPTPPAPPPPPPAVVIGSWVEVP